MPEMSTAHGEILRRVCRELIVNSDSEKCDRLLLSPKEELATDGLWILTGILQKAHGKQRNKWTIPLPLLLPLHE